MPSAKQTMVLNSPKKHSIRYDEARGEENPLFRAVYLNKIPELRGKTPAQITIEVSWND